MTRHAIALLLCLVTAAAAENATKIYVQKGDNVDLGESVEADHQFDVTSCILTLNNDTEVTLHPHPSNGLHSRFHLYTYEKCKVNVYGITKNDTGIWKIKSTYTKKSGKNETSHQQEYQYNVQVRECDHPLPYPTNYYNYCTVIQIFQKKEASPASTVAVYVDQVVSIHFDEKFDNLDSCILINSKKLEFDLASNAAEHIKLAGKCGIKMIAKKEYSDSWTLIAELKNSSAFYANFKITVKDKKELQLEQVNLLLKRGEKETISARNQDQVRHAKMCILEDPHGVKLPIVSGFCSKEILITQHHEGVWKAYYGFDGMESLVEQRINVQTYDVNPMKSTMTRSANGDINLLCQVRSHSMQFCTFVRPDGEMLHMTIGVGNKNYEYYGNGVHTQERFITGSISVYDCGVTIHNPKNIDYGSWRCLVRVSSSETMGRVLKVTQSARKNNVDRSLVSAKDAYAKLNEAFTIKCTADELLSYCWLRSPNGTVYSVIPGKSVERLVGKLSYNGNGLELGDCTALIDNAMETDGGKWTCHLGVADGPELETSFNVIVKDSHLMAAEDVVIIDKNLYTNLVCKPLPNSSKVIESCRWVNPAGHGINVAYGRYLSESGLIRCLLTIKTLNFDEDLGEWSCFARFSNSQDEGSAKILVAYQSSSNVSALSIALVVSLLVCTTFSIFVLIMYKRRLAAIAMTQLDEKIILEKPQMYP